MISIVVSKWINIADEFGSSDEARDKLAIPAGKPAIRW
jgi:hypothetical protein